MSKIAVIGAGAWGTAISIVLGRTGAHDVRLWAFEKEVCESISARRMNEHFLKGCIVPDSVNVTNSLAYVLRGAQIVVSVMPSHHSRRLFQSMAPHLNPQMMFVSATKGIENDTFLRMSEVICEVVRKESGFEPRISALSGPSFAREVAKGDPTAITIARKD